MGISEFFVKKNAKLSFTMIHNWAEDMVVRPRSVAQVEEGGLFLNNYICMKPVKIPADVSHDPPGGQGCRCPVLQHHRGQPGLRVRRRRPDLPEDSRVPARRSSPAPSATAAGSSAGAI